MSFHVVAPLRARTSADCDLKIAVNSVGVQITFGPRVIDHLGLCATDTLWVRLGDGADHGLLELRKAEPGARGWSIAAVKLGKGKQGLRVRIRVWEGCPQTWPTTSILCKPVDIDVIRFWLPWYEERRPTSEEVMAIEAEHLDDIEYSEAKRFLLGRGHKVISDKGVSGSFIDGALLSRDAVIAMAASLRDLVGQAG